MRTIPVTLSIYVHIPWCIHKCFYCDFNSHIINGILEESVYIDALLTDLEQEPSIINGQQVSTIFIGGGTPSLISPLGIGHLLDHLHARLPITANAEITMEANPGTVDIMSLTNFKAAGINRLSLGMQSFNDSSLARLGRIHDRAAALTAFNAARQAGFDNINLDLIFGLPGQDLQSARNDLVTACSLAPEHISYYQLTIEPHTAFHKNPPTLPDDDIIYAIQEQGGALLAAAGYHQYEISAYALPNRYCRHNLNYWEFGDYLGIGAGAHGKITNGSGIRRRWKLPDPKSYTLGIAGYPTIRDQHLGGDELISTADLPVEFMLNALRLVAGVSTPLYSQRTGLSLVDIADKLSSARTQGWLEDREDRLIPTVTGQRFLNDLLELFLPDNDD